MNKLEKTVYNIVKGNPKVKYAIRNIYQLLFDFLPRKENFFIGELVCKEDYFFGFHDITPFSFDDKYILANKLYIPLRMPTNDDYLGVGYWDEKMEIYREIGRSYAWNYHKGCRLQWLNSSEYKIIYNTKRKDRLCSVVYSLQDSNESIVDYPIDSTSSDGHWGTSFSYERLEKFMPGYGYNIQDASFLNEKTPANTGLFLVDILNNTANLILNIQDISLYGQDNHDVKAAWHYVTHSQFSPDGKYIAFLHRWVYNDFEKRNSRLIVCDLKGDIISVSPTNGMVSHFHWDEHNGIIAYCNVNGLDGHYYFTNERMNDFMLVAKEVLNSDGHQHFVPGSNKFVVDTYPDKYRCSQLFLVDKYTSQVERIAVVASPKQYQSPTSNLHWACDLHPRVSNNGNIVCFDSVHTGKRALCFMCKSSLYSS